MANCFIHFFVFHFSFVYELNGIYLFFRLFVCSKSRTRTFFGSSSIRNRSIFAHAIHMMTKSIDHPSFAWPHTHTANLENCLIACTLLWIWFFPPTLLLRIGRCCTSCIAKEAFQSTNSLLLAAPCHQQNTTNAHNSQQSERMSERTLTGDSSWLKLYQSSMVEKSQKRKIIKACVCYAAGAVTIASAVVVVGVVVYRGCAQRL